MLIFLFFCDGVGQSMKKKTNKHCKVSALLTAVLVTSTCSCLWGSSVHGETPITDANGNTYLASDNTNITGKSNSVPSGKNATIVGDNNTITKTFPRDNGSLVNAVGNEDVRIVGSNNTVQGSRRQHVIGDNNQIIARDAGTVTDYGHPSGREPNASDLTIGRGNFIRGTDTYRNEWDSLTVIGNNNKAEYSTESAGGPSAGIVIGDNQNIDTIDESVVIGSMSPAEQAQKSDQDPSDKKYTVGGYSTIIGYHTSSTPGGSVVVGNYSKSEQILQTITGHGTTIEGGNNLSGSYSSSYGALNTLESTATDTEEADNVANSVTGSLNRTAGTTGTMIVGSGNVVTNSKAPMIDNPALGSTIGDFSIQTIDMIGTDKLRAKTETTVEEGRHYMKEYMALSAGAVSILGSSNTADYAIRSQISGTNNVLKGQENNLSTFNTVSGYGNEGTNISRSTIVGTRNNLKNGEDNVVIGDFHNFDGGKHNVVLGSMAAEERDVTKSFTNIFDSSTSTYTVKELVATRRNTANVENAVMLGYNTDVIRNGGVALGSESIASVDKGIAGYDPITKAASTDSSPTWKSTAAAISVGDSTGTTVLTRQITNVAAGSEDTDAVNVAQLKRITADSTANINNQLTQVNNRIDAVDGRVKRVGAGAAALAALHPQDFDPNDHWTFAAGYGNYRGSSAMALGAFYRPNNKALYSVGASLGGGENLFNMGVSLKFGKSEPYADYSKAELVKVINDQNEKMNSMQEQIDRMMAKLNL